ncbi:MAG TPA: glycoside hydrolase family 3 C-terminal domain-containing protein [Candidatus Acidoferrales bacterium]
MKQFKRANRISMRRAVAQSAIFAFLVFIPALAQTPAPAPKPPYLDPSLPLDQRVNDLVSRLTLDEKASQMQDAAVAIPRLGIPAYNWWNEALHGVARAGNATVFPQAIGLAATWDTDLIHRVADVISTEARAKYIDAIAHGNTARYFGLTFWSPNINIFRDPRWGRGQETYGEDPFLTARIGVAFVTGLQGDDARYLKAISTPKHYAVHSGPEVLRHHFDVPVSPHDFADTYSPAFRATIMEGKADSVMCAYNSVLGTPACASPFLMDTLRNSWGFKGYVVSDCGAVDDIYQGHGYTQTLQQATALAVKAGDDLSCGSEYREVGDAVRDRLLSVADVDRSVKRLFEARFRLGMFDPPEMVPWSKLSLADNDTAANRALALQTARESIVLLKNDHNTLPLASTVKTIAVIGPTANLPAILLGNYNGTPSSSTTPLEGIRKRFANANVIYAAGSPLTETNSIPIPPGALRTGGANSQPGLKAEYFNNPNLQGEPATTRIDAQVNFDWRGVTPAPGLTGQLYSVRWTGELVAPVDGDYLLGGAAADGFRMYLDRKRILDDWNPHAERTRTTSVHLQRAHAYKIVMEYYHAARNPIARLLWSSPDMASDAVSAAKKADVVIAVVGITPQLEGEEMSTSAPGFFGGDRVDMELPRPQLEMLQAVAATGKPLIVVLTSGSALAVNWAQKNAAAVLEAWYPGEEGGTALANILAGDYNPSGRLPVTVYTGVAQLPPFEEYSMAGRTYRYFFGVPLYPFGFGLSYTNFTYANARVDRDQISATDDVKVSVDVKNSGAKDGDEIVELYITHPDVTGAPIRALAGFTHVHLAAGEQHTVTIPLHNREISVVDEAGKRHISPGTVELWIGGGQPIAGVGQTPPPGAKITFRVTSEASLPD